MPVAGTRIWGPVMESSLGATRETGPATNLKNTDTKHPNRKRRKATNKEPKTTTLSY